MYTCIPCWIIYYTTEVALVLSAVAYLTLINRVEKVSICWYKHFAVAIFFKVELWAGVVTILCE